MARSTKGGAALLELSGTPDPSASRRPIGWLTVGVAATAGLAVAGWWPAALATAALTVAELASGRRRADRSIVVRADADALRVDDPAEEEPWVFPLARLRAVRIHQQVADEERRDVLLMLADRNGPALTLRLLHDPSVAPEPDDLDVAALDALLGHSAEGMPAARLVRQSFDDPTGQLVRHLRAHAPPGVTDRVVLRLWRTEPDVAAPRSADGWLEVDGDLWRWVEGRSTDEGVFALPRLTRVGDTIRLELAGDRVLRFTAPAIAARATVGQDHPSDRWLEPREGGVLLTRLMARWPEETWPKALRHRVLGPPDGSRVRLPATTRRP